MQKSFNRLNNIMFYVVLAVSAVLVLSCPGCKDLEPASGEEDGDIKADGDYPYITDGDNNTDGDEDSSDGDADKSDIDYEKENDIPEGDSDGDNPDGDEDNTDGDTDTDTDTDNDNDNADRDEDSADEDQEVMDGDVDYDADSDAEMEFDSDDETEVEQDAEIEVELEVEPEVELEAEEDIPPATITIATYNVRRFFDDVCDSDDCGYDSYEPDVSASEYNSKAQAVADAIKKIDADVLLLQEIEKQDCLEKVKIKLPGQYNIYTIGETNYDASVDVAVVSKGTLVRTYDHQYMNIPHPDGGTTHFTREFYEVHLSFDGSAVIVFSAHFKSKANDDPSRRLAEARAAYNIILDVASSNPNALIVMGGDLNDYPGSDPMDALLSSGKLRRVADSISGNQDATYEYSGSPVAIDHLLLHKNSGGSYVEKSAIVIKDYYYDYSLGDSDHAALKAEFVLP